MIRLPPPAQHSQICVEQAIANRRSVRNYSTEALSLPHLSQILWAAQGLTGAGRYRAVPSAGATYPLELYVFTGEQTVEGLEAGVYHYVVESHSLELHKAGDARAELSKAALGQRFVAHAPMDIVICAFYQRTARVYGRRAERYVHMEAGHVGQNIHLQAITLGLGVVMVGAFHDEWVALVISLPQELNPLYIIPVGKPT